MLPKVMKKANSKASDSGVDGSGAPSPSILLTGQTD